MPGIFEGGLYIIDIFSAEEGKVTGERQTRPAKLQKKEAPEKLAYFLTFLY